MSTNLSTGKNTPTVGAKTKQTGMTPDQRRQVTIIGIAAVVVLGMGAAIFAYFNKTEVDPMPRINGGLDQIVPFVASRQFEKMDFDRQVLYWKELAGKKKEIEAMYKAGSISKDQYREVLSVTWIGNRYKWVQKYFSLGPLDQKDLIDQYLDREGSQAPKVPGAILKDDNRIKALIETFPAEVRQKFEQFHQAINDRKKERKAEDKAIKQAAKQEAAAKPATPRGAERLGITTSPADVKNPRLPR